ncbi:MAG: hypothetical protein KGQ60_12860, partial [Planctomycetes bacterium]|nr:hypothetical protein [Planctomycetota bacterium]
LGESAEDILSFRIESTPHCRGKFLTTMFHESLLVGSAIAFLYNSRRPGLRPFQAYTQHYCRLSGCCLH